MTFYYSIGPVSNTLVHFWRLIWQEKSPIIVMITNVIEEGKVKCQQYWPDSDTKDYGPFSVTLSDEQVLTDYTVRKMHVKVKDYQNE